MSQPLPTLPIIEELHKMLDKMLTPKSDAVFQASLAEAKFLKQEYLLALQKVHGEGAAAYAEDILELLSFGRIFAPLTGGAADGSFNMMINMMTTADINSGIAHKVSDELRESIRDSAKILFDKILGLVPSAVSGRG